ncbi:MAG TPA: prepilin-type N-terminal cleavage/methylation domain-containing protein [Thermoleophilaceae bacterium]|jgi:type II secretory pathway pseudopilin PulG
MSRLKDESGFSLTELLVAIILAVIIFGAAVTTFVEFLTVSTRSEEQTRAQDMARSSIERIGGHLRNAMTTSASGAAVNPVSNGFDLVFLAPLPSTTTSTTNTRGLTHLRYCLENKGSNVDTIWFQTAPYNSGSLASPPSTATCPSKTWSTKTQMFDHLVNRKQSGTPPLFTLITDGAATPSVVAVEIHPMIDWNPAKKPLYTELRTTVNLRNLNRAPVAGLVCNPLANGHVICDASSSMDPDGQQLTYSWKMNGTELAGETSYRLDKYPLTSKLSYSFELTVTDSAGVTSSATKSVTMP